MRIAIDTGGTFTDCVYWQDGAPVVLKVLSTPDAPARAVLEAIRRIGARDSVEVRHGTTIGTNALLEHKGERVSAEGEILREPSDEDLSGLRQKVRTSGAESIAISLLFSFANPENERRVVAELRELG